MLIVKADLLWRGKSTPVWCQHPPLCAHRCRDTPRPGQYPEVYSFPPLKHFLDGSHDHLGRKEFILKGFLRQKTHSGNTYTVYSASSQDLTPYPMCESSSDRAPASSLRWTDGQFARGWEGGSDSSSHYTYRLPQPGIKHERVSMNKEEDTSNAHQRVAAFFFL